MRFFYYAPSIQNDIGTNGEAFNTLLSLVEKNETKAINVFRRPKPVRMVEQSSQNISKSTTQSSTTSWFEEMEAKYLKINKRIQEVCREIQSYNPSDIENRNPEVLISNIYRHMVVDEDHGLSYCRHGKVLQIIFINVILFSKYYFKDFSVKYISYSNFQVGTTTFLYHFSHLTHDIKPDIQDEIEKQDQHSYKIMHNHVPPHFKLKSTSFKRTKSAKGTLLNSKQFFQSYNDYIHKNNVLSFSFVRHPFERYSKYFC